MREQRELVDRKDRKDHKAQQGLRDCKVCLEPCPREAISSWWREARCHLATPSSAASAKWCSLGQGVVTIIKRSISTFTARTNLRARGHREFPVAFFI